MKQFLKIYLPSASITFSLTTVCTCVINLVNGFSTQRNSWLLELFGFILMVDALDWILGNINFKSFLSYAVTEMLIAYIGLLLFGYFAKWFSFFDTSFIYATIIFCIVFPVIHLYFYHLSRMNADEINKMLEIK